MDTTSGTLIRDARHRARLSQTDLAQRAGVAQSVISAYENDQREPGLRTLLRLIEATGYELSLDLVPVPRQATEPSETQLERLRRHRDTIIEMAERRGMHNVRVFGSVARGEETKDSDVDLLVDVDKGVSLIKLIGVEDQLADLLGVKVDLVPADGLKDRFRDNILAEAVPL
ncbi:MAG TPA: nucleotidyltransferase domain-containing protein [Pseudonocardiaceae bacterium]|nr:nucleotidyltransferase domain-containing protein [Pseudonocardiaceae bacterium]